MPKAPLNLTPELGFRTNNFTRDSRKVNCYTEKVAGMTYAVKRPGILSYAVTPALSGVGQGLKAYNSNLYAAAGGTLSKIVSGVSSTIISGLNSTNQFSFVTTEPSNSPHPYLVYHDGVNGYSLDAAGNNYLINGMIYLVSLTNAGGTGYSNNTFTVTGSISGSGCTGTYATSGGAITSFTITNQGSNYAGTLTVVIAGAGR